MTKYYKTGQIAKMTNLSERTIRYYDRIGLLKPSTIGENGYRLYTDKDFMKLQKILSLKYLGFSLEDIQSMTMNDNYISLQESIDFQKRMIDQKMDNLKIIKKSLIETEEYIQQNKQINWEDILKNIHFTSMEKDLIQQYKDSTNLDIRIRLHEKYSTNPIAWFQWLFNLYQVKNNDKVLEIGCGNGELWKQNKEKIPSASIILSDISQGMVNDAKRELGHIEGFQFECFDCHHLPYEDETFDVVIANHVLFYLKDMKMVLQEIKRVLKKRGIFYCSTYGKKHMKEITDIVKEYNPKIVLSHVQLYEIFGLENGYDILSSVFTDITLEKYQDDLIVDNADDISNYILSCHGNQIDYILKDAHAFKNFISKKVNPFIKITKDAGMFICRKLS